MCGIFGYTGKEFSPELLVDGIRRLEYRGYDSWGIALQRSDDLYLHRAAGRIPGTIPESIPTDGFIGGIAHTRWATHGAPTEKNAHPHTDCTGTLAIVHNGIIENYSSLRQKLEKLGHSFPSETV